MSFGQMTKDVADAFNRLARPTLTILVAAVFNVAAMWAFMKGVINWEQFATALGPTNGMIIGFWFGEKSALKNPMFPEAPQPKEPEER